MSDMLRLENSCFRVAVASFSTPSMKSVLNTGGKKDQMASNTVSRIATADSPKKNRVNLSDALFEP
jgi:hypothetical protein